jgi:beta-lactamase class A
MGIFGRKKIKDEENEKTGHEKDAGQESKNKRVKKIKDLNPENKRKRKEPIRPWNNLDRIVLLILILVTFFTSFYFAISSKGFKFPNLIPNINPFSDRTIILRSIEQGKIRPDGIVNDFKQIVNDLRGTYGFYVINLADGNSFGLHDGESFQAASLIKLPVMVGMYMEEEGGGINLDNIYTLKKEDKVKGSGSLYGKPVGYKITYRDLIKFMGKESDNTAFNICRKYLGDTKIDNIITQIGMSSTSLKSNETSLDDIGLFFRKLQMGDLINGSNKDELLSFMTNTIYENWLAKGLPNGVKIAHKYGREAGVVNDAGIVFSDPSYVVVIMSKNADVYEADSVFPEASKLIYEGMVASK